MRTVLEVITGALIFMGIDRLSRIISRSIVQKNRDSNEIKMAMLRIELLTLFVSLLILLQFIKLD